MGKPKKQSSSSKNSSKDSSYIAVGILTAALFGVCGIALFQYRQLLHLRNERSSLDRLNRYTSFEHRTGNAPWTLKLTNYEESFRSQVELDTNRPVEELVARLEGWPQFLDSSGMSEDWLKHLDETTPTAFQGGSTATSDPSSPEFIDCRNVGNVTIPKHILADRKAFYNDPTHMQRAMNALRECGYVVLENLFPREEMVSYHETYKEFISTEEAKDFRYPCQGKGRIEYMMPFRSPFNDSLYSNDQLQDIIFSWLRGKFKLELITVINSLAGSGNQRWHQGWQYLFHPEERTPPYAIVVGIPLVDVTREMGPTQFCPRAKMRFYQGWRCQDEPFSIPSTLGSVIIFDYKTLHRGPENQTPFARPMISMVFSKMFFVNTEAMMNRGISLLQTIHQRLYWEQFKLHPESDDYFIV